MTNLSSELLEQLLNQVHLKSESEIREETIETNEKEKKTKKRKNVY
jgi:hypothetical protein